MQGLLGQVFGSLNAVRGHTGWIDDEICQFNEKLLYGFALLPMITVRAYWLIDFKPN